MLREALRPPTEHELWLEQMKQVSSIHPSTEFRDHQADDTVMKMGPQCIIERDVTIGIALDAHYNSNLVFGEGVYVGRNCYISCYHPISIGANTLIGAYCYIISANHNFSDRGVLIRKQGYIGAPINIGRDVWIGAHVIVLPGIHIGDGAVIGGGSVVTKNIPPFQVWVGNPARYLRDR